MIAPNARDVPDFGRPGDGQSLETAASFAPEPLISDAVPFSLRLSPLPTDPARIHFEGEAEIPTNRADLGRDLFVGGLLVAGLGGLIWYGATRPRQQQWQSNDRGAVG